MAALARVIVGHQVAYGDDEVTAELGVLPPDVTASLQQDFGFYTWDQATGEVRWMCSWDTTEADVDQFISAIKAQVTAT